MDRTTKTFHVYLLGPSDFKVFNFVHHNQKCHHYTLWKCEIHTYGQSCVASLSSRSGRTSKHCQRRQAAAITASCHARPTPPLPGKKKEAESERKGKRNLMRREENRRGMGGDRRQGKRTGDEKGGKREGRGKGGGDKEKDSKGMGRDWKGGRAGRGDNC